LGCEEVCERIYSVVKLVTTFKGLLKEGIQVYWSRNFKSFPESRAHHISPLAYGLDLSEVSKLLV
jgi:hypothetical protein